MPGRGHAGSAGVAVRFAGREPKEAGGVSKERSLNYTSYLALEEILGAQRPRSDEHDEILFIVVHQVYELWFKQLIHELRYLQKMLEEGNDARAFATFKRLLTILKLVVAQLDVIETMTPVQFLAFRDLLEQSSGFQSGQFRELEAILGRRDPGVLDAYHEGSVDYEKVKAAMARPSVYDSFLRYLAERGYPVPEETLQRDVTQPVEESAGVQAALLAAYRDDGEPAQVAERLVDFDEGFMEWRYHHVKMVERTIGSRAGTGGSAGAAYLRTTLHKPFFPDLWTVRAEL
jgi:tryptophan 2,3-dioxygenase